MKNAQRLALLISLSFSAMAVAGCSHLEDYSGDISSIPIPQTSVSPSPSASPSPATLPLADHEWNFENNASDTGNSTTPWNGNATTGTTYSAVSPKVGSYSLLTSGTSGQFFSLGTQTFNAQSTVACWVKWSSTVGTSTSEVIFANSLSTSFDGFELSANPSNGVMTFSTGHASASTSFTSTTPLTAGSYIHVAVTFDTSANTAQLYYNGVLNNMGSTQAGMALSDGFYLGGTTDGNAAFNGNLDDCRVYNEALSAAQITLLYQSY